MKDDRREIVSREKRADQAANTNFWQPENYCQENFADMEKSVGIRNTLIVQTEDWEFLSL
jgi:hypothetical protein